jgi:hypothetical protein
MDTSMLWPFYVAMIATCGAPTVLRRLGLGRLSGRPTSGWNARDWRRVAGGKSATEKYTTLGRDDQVPRTVGAPRQRSG